MPMWGVAPVMRAVAIKAFQSPPELMDLPKPTPGPGEILVHLGAASINPVDWKIAEGSRPGAPPPNFPFILGVDGAGVVEGLGEGASRFKVGEGVFGQFLHAPFGKGTYAEFIAAPESLGISKTPRGIYTAQAAAVPTAGMTALTAVEALGLHKGQTLLIQGAKGGVGSFATQLASNLGILVVATSRGDHGAFQRKLGAYEVPSIRLASGGPGISEVPTPAVSMPPSTSSGPTCSPTRPRPWSGMAE